MDVQDFIDAGLYEPDAPDAEERLAVLRLNIDHGVTLDEMIEAGNDGRLALLAGRRVNLGREPRLSLNEVSRRAGEPPSLLARIWKAAGFAEPDPSEPMFTELSLEVLELFRAASAVYGEDVTLQLARVIGSSIARIADAEVTAFVQNVAAPLAEERNELAITQAHIQLASLNPLLAKAFDLVHRYHCEAALRRVALVPGSGHGQRLAVGFADLVGFSALSQSLPSPDLANAISAFEERARETVTAAGGRVIKLIGDEVMFVADEPRQGCEVALRLVEEFSNHEVLPPIRGGLATGETITQEGDYFGPVVNLAARATKIAPAESVFVPESFAAEVGDADDVSFHPVGARRLKGFAEPIMLYRLGRAQ